jgi:hypothetical protein
MAAHDWRTHSVGSPLPCQICHHPAMCRDEHGHPCHKVCADGEPASVPIDGDRVALVVDLDAYRTTRHRRTA